MKSISKGKDADKYQRVVSHAFGRIFRGSLRNMSLKADMDSGIKEVDAVFTNCADKGFFHDLKNKVECNYIMVEVKNISIDPENTEVDQLNGRFDPKRGCFGILICAEISDKKKVVARCRTHIGNGNHIIVLTSQDIIELLEYKREENIDDINDFMDKKLKEILF